MATSQGPLKSSTLTTTSTAATSALIGGGVTAGTGTVGIITAAGKLASINTTYVATLTSNAVGKILRSDGTNFLNSTATYPDTAATAGAYLRADGTNWITSTLVLPNAIAIGEVVVGTGTNQVGVIASANAGKIFQAAGGGVVPAWTTATYPDTATATGTILRADGTNWVATTATYPATGGSAGTFLRSDGTNWGASTLVLPNTATTGDLHYASAANTISNLAAVALGQVLVSAGTGTAPAYSASPQVTAIGLGTAAASAGIKFSSSTPGVTTAALYSPNGIDLYFNGGQLAPTANINGTTNTVPLFTSSTTIGNSVITQAAGAITVAGRITGTGDAIINRGANPFVIAQSTSSDAYLRVEVPATNLTAATEYDNGVTEWYEGLIGAVSTDGAFRWYQNSTVEMALSTAGILTLPQNGLHTAGAGGSSTGTNTGWNLNGTSGAAYGAYVAFQVAGTTKGIIGREAAAIASGTSNALFLGSVSDAVKLASNSVVALTLDTSQNATFAGAILSVGSVTSTGILTLTSNGVSTIGAGGLSTGTNTALNLSGTSGAGYGAYVAFQVAGTTKGIIGREAACIASGSANNLFIGSAADPIDFASGGTTVQMSLSTAGLLSLTQNGLHSVGAGGSATGTNTGFNLNGTSGAAYGAYIAFQVAGTTKGIIGREAAVIASGSSNALFLGATADSVKLASNGTVALTLDTSQHATFAGGLSAGGTINADASMSNNATVGLFFRAATGSVFDLAVNNPGGGSTIMAVPTGTVGVKLFGGLQMGAPTGGDKGAGTINVASDIYKNNTAYANPDYVFEHWATGAIDRFSANEGASAYAGLQPLSDVEMTARTSLVLPRIAEWRAGKTGSMGMFGGSDALLASLEEAYLYLFQHEARLTALESAQE